MFQNPQQHLQCRTNSPPFPYSLENSNIITIPKPGKSPLIPQNRRPISLLNTLGKIYEKLILRRISQHALQIIPDTQFGFVPHRSTTLQLLRLTKYIQTGYDNYQHTAAIFLDVEKAYDTVWIPGLLHKLIQYGFPETFIHIIATYLTDRKFQVKIDGALSSPRKIHTGVPQGAILASILYNIYTADASTNKSLQIAQYAQDTVLLYKTSDSNSCTKVI